MELIPQPNNLNKEQGGNEVISINECKQYLSVFDLSDQKIFEIRNTLIGIAGKSIDSYLDNFI
ncbi:MAG: hypothetical protein Q7S37_02775 [bacterium]|nr:hypothetical protein [bacterium]